MKTFVTSDHHFGHRNILNFRWDEDIRLRNFPDYEAMEEYMIDSWNTVIGPTDKVYHLGDFSMSKKHISIAGRLNGRKTLIQGNHDIYNTSEYLKGGFDNVRAYRVFPKNGIILSHIPIHPHSLKHGWLNIHGHLHAGVVERYPEAFDEDQRCLPDNRYYNVSVEMHDYRPVDLQFIIDRREEGNL